MSFFLLTLLGLTGSFGGLLAFRQATWKNSHYNIWREAKRKEKREAKRKRLEEKRAAEEKHKADEEKRKADEELSRKNVAEWKKQHQFTHVSGSMNHASYPQPTGAYAPYANISGVYVGYQSSRNLQAELEEEKRRRQHIKKYGSMQGYHAEIELRPNPPIYTPRPISRLHVLEEDEIDNKISSTIFMMELLDKNNRVEPITINVDAPQPERSNYNESELNQTDNSFDSYDGGSSDSGGSFD